MSFKIMKFFMVIVLLTTGLFACAKTDPKPDPDPDPNNPVELSASYLGVLGNTSGNLANGGLFAENDGWIYYSDVLDFNRLTKMKTDGSEKSRLGDDWNVGMINVIGDWVYYVPGAIFNGRGSITRIKTDGSAKEVIVEDFVLALAVKGNYMYFVSAGTGQLVRSKTDGSDQRRLVDEDVTGLTLSGQWVVYKQWVSEATSGSMTQQINTIRLDGEVTGQLGKGICSGNLIADDVAVYCLSNAGIKKIMTDGSGISEISIGERTTSFTMTLDRFMYSTESSIISIDHAGNSKTVLSTKPNTYGLNTAGNWLYFNESLSWDSTYRVTLDGKIEENLRDKLLVDPSSPAPKGPDSLVHNESWVLQIDGWFYHGVPDFLDKTSGTQSETLFPYGISGMVQVGEWIYFLEWTTIFTKSIDRIKTDGSQFGRLTDNTVTSLTVKDDWIYYRKNDERLYRMKTNGSANTKLSNDRISFMTIDQDWIYYSVGSGSTGGEGGESTYVSSDIHRMKLDGSQAETIYIGSAGNVVSDGTGLFFIKATETKYALWKMSFEGTDLALVQNDVTTIRAVSPGWIYTTTSVTDRSIAITRVKTDGSVMDNLVTIAGDNTMIEIIGDKIYYTIYNSEGYREIHSMDLDGKNQQLVIN